MQKEKIDSNVDMQAARLQALQRQAERLERRLRLLDNRSNRYSWIRLAIFLGGLVLSLLIALATRWWVGLLGLVVTIVAFGTVAYFHRTIDRSLGRHKILLQIRRTQIARMQLNWAGIPQANTRATDPDHPFETDLDITGERSLHRLLNTAFSLEGSARLLEWLLNTSPDLETIRERQALVRELTPLVIFRDTLQTRSLLATRDLAEQWEGRKLLHWLQAHAGAKRLGLTLVIACVISLVTLGLGLLSIFAGFPQYWSLSLLLALVFFYARRGDAGDIFEEALSLDALFSQLSTLFTYLEAYPYHNRPHLQQLCAPFFVAREQRPSRLIARISRILTGASLSKNPLLLILINSLVPWEFFIAYRLKQEKALLTANLPTWLDTWFKLEALCSLANFAYLNPQYIQPEVRARAEANGQAVFTGQDLGHPLLPPTKKIANSFTLQQLGEVVIITGSNMAGKSTFLRTLGINLCLAYAGGPVSAASLSTCLFKIFTCIRVSDSVTDGYSYFYAEVRRLRALLVELQRGQKAGDYPLFFLIDEIFKGTNNRERLIGSRSYLRALVGQNCAGAVSTHDLELVTLADKLPQVTNYHFREEVIDGQMVFDYILRPGPCPTTNALKIMQMEGLPIDQGSI